MVGCWGSCLTPTYRSFYFSMSSPFPTFALLDDCHATAAAPFSRLYTHYVHQRICMDGTQWEAVCEEVEEDLQAGLHAVVLAEYEWGVKLHLHDHATDFAPQTACRFLLFRECAKLSQQQVLAWLEHASAAENGVGKIGKHPLSSITHLQASCTETEFVRVFNTIQAALQAGEMYQMNFTYRLYFDVLGSPFSLYQRLRERQPTAYGALITLPTGDWVLSFSPELFLQNQGGKLTAKPMKGTAARSPDVSHCNAATDLAASIKNRAENVMIVDLLRNDLSQIAQQGSVQVPELFKVEPYGTVWQMSSTVQAQLQEGLTFAQIMRALFPCGSITGAPKHSSMQWIHQLENTPRGLYTGAIGWLDVASRTGLPPSSSNNKGVCGDFCLSVAIRTITLKPAQEPMHWAGILGIGAGIVLDSIAYDEFKECGLKARFLTQLDSNFTLLETMYATHEQGIRHARRHARRLRRASYYFGFVWQPRSIYKQLQAIIAALPPMQPFKIRLTLDAMGKCTFSTEALPPPLTQPVPVLLASDLGLGPAFGNSAESVPPLPSTSISGTAPSHQQPIWLQYKTSVRPDYNQALQLAKELGVFDLLFVNRNGELTEGARTNLFLKLKGRWYTPPISSGALPGVMRAVLLDDPTFQAAEQVLTLNDLYQAEAMLLCNALHGPLVAYLDRLK